MKYRIWMKEICGFSEGWCCGHSARINSPFHRTLNKEDADVYDAENALGIMMGYRSYGYPCTIDPKIPDDVKLRLLDIED